MYEAALGLSVLCFLGVLGWYGRSPSFSIFHPLTYYCAFHGFLFVVRPILAFIGQYKQVYYTYGFMPSESDKITVILASNLGFLVFTFFCMRLGNIPMRFSDDVAIREERRRLSQLFVWVIVICGPLAAYSLSKTFSATDNVFEGLTMDRSTGVMINTKTIGYVTDMQLMAVSMCALLIWLGNFRPLTWVPVATFVLLRAGSGGRGPFVAALVSAGMFYLYEKRMRYPGFRVVAGAALVVSLFSIVGADRGAGIRQLLGFEQESGFTETESKRQGLEGMDFANMEYFEFLVYVIPQRSGTYDYFLENFQVLTEPVPRVLWPGKPVGEPFRRIWLFDYGFPVGMTRSLPGEGWYALGWLGVVIWCGLWGHCLGLVYRGFVRSPQTTFQTACYMVFAPTLVVAFRDGSLLTIVRQTGVYFTPIAVWAMLAKYTGVPNANQIRAMLALQARRLAAQPRKGTGDAAAPEPGRLSGTAAAMARLPGAVRRRRAMLAQSQDLKPAE